MAVESTPYRSLSDLFSSSRAAEATTGCTPASPRCGVAIIAASVCSIVRDGSERIDATPASGRVILTLDAQGSQARVRVEDTGCGMTEDFIQNRLFKPFQTTKASGMGIGAHESYQYVHELGGKISVQSELNRGTTVTLLLPLFHAQADAPVTALDVQ